jgi:hypothetical protein
MRKILCQLSCYFAILFAIVVFFCTAAHTIISRVPAGEGRFDWRGIGLLLCWVVPVLSVLLAALIMRLISAKMRWYESLLDSIPFPLSVTDMNMKWTFVNRPVEEMLKTKRAALTGKPCSNWGAAICNTEKCGVTCLRSGKPQTLFDQWGMHFKVDSSYITDGSGKKIGHVELVQDITATTKFRNQQVESIGGFYNVVQSFLTATNEIAEESQQVAAATAEQNTTIASLLELVESLSDKTENNVAIADKAMKLAVTIEANAEQGSVQMSAMSQAVNDISVASKSISDVMKVIDGIAFQTNILALNAAVEAARAGTHGKGFAVVAEEVRSLASKSADAAQNTGSLIADSTQKAVLGENIAGEATASFNEIMNGINDSASMTKEIVAASGEQRTAIDSIKAGIRQIADAIRQLRVTAERLAESSKESSREMGNEIIILKEMVEQLRQEGKSS